MRVKMFELRDRATFIPALAINLSPRNEAERYLLLRAGYGETKEDHEEYVLLCRIEGGRGMATCDPYNWTGNRTLHVAHQHIIEHFSDLESGDVIDVEFILGETERPKEPERLMYPG
jgi:hypothetical protein